MPIGLVVNPDAAVPKPFAEIMQLYPVLNTEFRTLQKKIKKSAKRESGLCHGLVNPKYVSYTIQKHPYLLFSLDDEGELDGFAAISKFDDNTISVYLLCSHPRSHGIGSKLHKEIEKIAASVGINKLVLKSLPESMGFYEKLGYVLDYDVPFEDTAEEEEKNNNTDEFAGIASIPMSKTLGAAAGAGGGAGANKKGGSRKSRKAKSNRKTRKSRKYK